MEAARAAVSKITGRQGHTTEVDEVVNPAITREVVKPTRHEETQQAIDKEVHQDHYHTTVQPLQHREVLPEQHVHNVAPIQKREFTHGDHEGVKRNVATELGQFRDSSVTHDTQHTRSAAAAVTGEHVHHHVHETVQPIIHKETVQPEVVHTVIPIHETHHAAAQHHGMSALPMKSLSEFQTTGGSLTGSQRHTHEEYEGGPRPYNKDLQTTAEKILHVGGHHTSGTGVGTTGHHTTGTGIGSGVGTGVGTTGHHTGQHTGTGIGSGVGTTGHHTTGTGIGSGVGTTGQHTGHHTGTGVGAGVGAAGVGAGVAGVAAGRHHRSGSISSSDEEKAAKKASGKPSLLDRLNPRKDTDHDGKTGIMD